MFLWFHIFLFHVLLGLSNFIKMPWKTAKSDNNFHCVLYFTLKHNNKIQQKSYVGITIISQWVLGFSFIVIELPTFLLSYNIRELYFFLYFLSHSNSYPRLTAITWMTKFSTNIFSYCFYKGKSVFFLRFWIFFVFNV